MSPSYRFKTRVLSELYFLMSLVKDLFVLTSVCLSQLRGRCQRGRGEETAAVLPTLSPALRPQSGHHREY